MQARAPAKTSLVQSKVLRSLMINIYCEILVHFTSLCLKYHLASLEVIYLFGGTAVILNM